MKRFETLDSMLMDEDELENTVDTETDTESESEEEFSTSMIQPRRSLRNFTTTSSKWSHIVELEGIRPQNVTAKVNMKCRLLVIKVKESTSSNTFSRGGSFSLPSGKLVRTIPLPDDIIIEQLQVKVLSHGKLLITAPFMKSQDYSMRKENWSRYPTWLSIPVSHKETSDKMYRPTDSSFRMNSLDLEDESIFHGRQHKRNTMKSSNKWHRGLLRFTSKLIDESGIEKVIRPDFVKDQSTGKMCLIMKFNTMGFSTENIRVEVMQNDQLLLIEAKEEKMKSLEGQELLKQLKDGLPVKSFRREFLLPEKIVDVSNIGFCVLKSGILIVSLPLTQTEGLDVSESDMKNVDDVKKECDSWKKVRGGKSQ